MGIHGQAAISGIFALLLIALSGCQDDDDDGPFGPGPGPAPVSDLPSESGRVQIDRADTRVVAVNKTSISTPGSLSVFQVRDAAGNDAVRKLGEIPVGVDPESVSFHPNGAVAYVSNEADGTVSVVDVVGFRRLATIAVGSEPRGTALSPTGARLYVANFSDGTVSVINTATNTVTRTIDLKSGAGVGNRPVLNPYAVAVSNDRDADDSDERIFVTDFFGRAIPGTATDQREAFDTSKEGRIAVISAATETVTAIATLAPAASGFTQDRRQFNPANNPNAKPGNPYIAPAGVAEDAVPANAYFNQLSSISVDPASGDLYVTSIAAQPEPPVNFLVNVQAVIGVIDGQTRLEVAAKKVNLNSLVTVEPLPAPPFTAGSANAGSLTRLFAGDTVDMAIRNGVVLFVSRAGSHVLKGAIGAGGVITLNNSATTPAVRFATGNIPHGVVMNRAGTRAYALAEVDATLTSINLASNTQIAETPSTELPPTGSTGHRVLIGAVAFFTGLGLDPGADLDGADVRAIDTRFFRNIAANNNISSCASCHYRGTTDAVTWSFDAGPRQSISLDSSFSHAGPAIQRVFNWNAVRGSVTDFNNNSRGVQGGFGFTPMALAHLSSGGTLATVPDRGLVFNHGRNAGVSDALDLQTLWVRQAVRTFNGPSNLSLGSVSAGRTAFDALNCESCHGGALWTSSQVRWAYPLFDSDPVVPSPAPHVPRDPRVRNINAPPGGPFVGTVVDAFDASEPADGVFETPVVTRFMGDPTLDIANDPIEIRGAGGQIGQGPVGAGGSFNPPSLLMLGMTGPYGHHGRAQSLAEVFVSRAEGGLGHPAFGATPQQLDDIVEFLKSIDATTPPF